jgi:hypothetical protein
LSQTGLLSIEDMAANTGLSRWTITRALAADGIGAAGQGLPLNDYIAWIRTQAVNPQEKETEMLATLPVLHNFENVAETYGLSLRSLKDKAREGEFSHTRIGRGWFFTEAQLEAFFAAREVKSTGDVRVEQQRALLARRRPRQRRPQ